MDRWLRAAGPGPPGSLPVAAASCPEQTAGPQYLTTLQSKALTFAAHAHPKMLPDPTNAYFLGPKKRRRQPGHLTPGF